MSEVLTEAIREVRETLLSHPVSPRVETPQDINLHFCRYVAETVADRVGDEIDIQILEDGRHGYAHTWISHDDQHYDAECPEGVDDHRELPFFQRHPEAAYHVESGSADQAVVRHRGSRSLYPNINMISEK